MKPDGYKEQYFAACCGKCCYSGEQVNLHLDLLCYHGDSEEAVNNSLSLEGDDLDNWWVSRHVDYDGLCPMFRAGDPQEVSWSSDYESRE